MLISKETLLSWIVRFILEQLRSGGNIQKVARWLELVAAPTLQAWRTDLFEMLMRKAQSTDTTVDDATIQFLNNLIDRLISNCTPSGHVPQ